MANCGILMIRLFRQLKLHWLFCVIFFISGIIFIINNEHVDPISANKTKISTVLLFTVQKEVLDMKMIGARDEQETKPFKFNSSLHSLLMEAGRKKSDDKRPVNEVWNSQATKALFRHTNIVETKWMKMTPTNYTEQATDNDNSNRKHEPVTTVHIVVVSCGERFEETLVLIKSALLTTRCFIHFHIFIEGQNSSFSQKLLHWSALFGDMFRYSLYNTSFPASNGLTPDFWKNWENSRPCSTQRLFIAELLPQLDSVLYVDTDVLFLAPVNEIWQLFYNFNDIQLASLAAEHELKEIGWYNRFGKHPYYGETGLNAGIMLMNLTRLRTAHWLLRIQQYAVYYKKNIVFGDQDLINIYFHFHPDQIYVMPCGYNYRTDHCQHSTNCKYVEKYGILALHGSRRVWVNEDEISFKAVYTAFKEIDVEDSIEKLIETIEYQVNITQETDCGKMSWAYTYILRSIAYTYRSVPARLMG